VSNKVVTVADLPEKFHQLAIADTERASINPKAPDRTVSIAMPATGGLAFGEGGIDLNEMVSSLERNLIIQALEKARGVRSKAAQLLSLNRTTLLEKMKKMSIDIKKQ
jgi:DNA-binding NtrC family response regulator